MSEQTYDDMLPNPGLDVDKDRTALVITDPQRDFLSEDGVVWGVVGESVKENNTVEHLRQLMTTAHEVGIPIFISPITTIPTTTPGTSVERSRR